MKGIFEMFKFGLVKFEIIIPYVYEPSIRIPFGDMITWYLSTISHDAPYPSFLYVYSVKLHLAFKANNEA